MYTPLESTGKINLMLDLIAQRQRALGSNLANVDTPNYVRKDINFQNKTFIPIEFISLTVTIALHLWKHNSLISIFSGTAIYMLLQ